MIKFAFFFFFWGWVNQILWIKGVDEI